MKKLSGIILLIGLFIIGCEKENLNTHKPEKFQNIEFRVAPQPNETCNIVYLDVALIVNEIDAIIGLSNAQINWLNCRQLETGQIRNFLNSTNLNYDERKDIVEAHLFLLMTDVDYYLINKEFATLPT